MNPKMGRLFWACAERFHPEQSARLAHYLPQEEQSAFIDLPSPSPQELSALQRSDQWLDRLHASWLEPPLRSFGEEPGALFFSILPEKMQNALPQMAPPKRRPAPFLRPYLLAILKQKICRTGLLAIEELSPSELTPLLQLNEEELFHMVDLLGIHDLAQELRTIVDKALLHAIYEALTKQQLFFLHACMKQPTVWASPPLYLSSWDRERSSLHALLHKRGLIRLGRALIGEETSFQWHVLHLFDRLRGEALRKVIEMPVDPQALVQFKKQVIHLLQRRTVA